MSYVVSPLPTPSNPWGMLHRSYRWFKRKSLSSWSHNLNVMSLFYFIGLFTANRHVLIGGSCYLIKGVPKNEWWRPVPKTINTLLMSLLSRLLDI